MSDILGIDPWSGLPIRATDNGKKDGDLEADQTPKPLSLDENGLPMGWEAPNANR